MSNSSVSMEEDVSSESSGDDYAFFLTPETREIGLVQARRTSLLQDMDQMYADEDNQCGMVLRKMMERWRSVEEYRNSTRDFMSTYSPVDSPARESVRRIGDKWILERDAQPHWPLETKPVECMQLCSRGAVVNFPFFVEAKETKKDNADQVYVNINKIYQFRERIRKGRYTTINKYYSKILDKDVAIKTIPKVGIPSERLFKFVPRELDVAEDKEFGHPNIVKFLDTYDTGIRCYIIMEYVDDGNLTDYIKSRGRLDPYSYKLFFGHLISAVYYCIEHGICHRKLSTENCLISKNFELKLCDFSYSCPMEDRDGVKSTHCGVLGFLAPEILMGRHYQPWLTESWSCGVILFTMIYGAMPFNSTNFPRLLKAVKKPIKFQWYHDTTIDPIMIMHMTISPVKKRWSIMKVHGHSWVSPRPTKGYEYYKNWFKEHNLVWGNKNEESIEKELLKLKKRDLRKCLNTTI